MNNLSVSTYVERDNKTFIYLYYYDRRGTCKYQTL